MHTLSVGESLRFAWNTFKKRPGILVGGFALGAVVMIVVSTVLNTEDMDPSLLTFAMGVASMLIGIVVEMGFTAFALRSHDAVESVRIHDLWHPTPFWKYVGVKLLTGLIVILGLILLIVPGIILALGLMFGTYLVIDKHRGPVEALKESWNLSKGHKWQLFLLVLTIVALNLVGFLAFIVGLLITVPISLLMMAHAYRKLSGPAAVVA